MNPVVLVVVIVVALVVIYQGLRMVRGGGGDYLSQQMRRSARHEPVPTELINHDALNDMVLQGYLKRRLKINAIKRYRELTGLGLKEAKDVIDAAERGDIVPGYGQGAAAVQNAPASATSTDTDDVSDSGIRDLIKRGNKIGAIKAYREFTGAGLAEAKDAVEKIEREMNLG